MLSAVSHNTELLSASQRTVVPSSEERQRQQLIYYVGNKAVKTVWKTNNSCVCSYKSTKVTYCRFNSQQPFHNKGLPRKVRKMFIVKVLKEVLKSWSLLES